MSLIFSGWFRFLVLAGMWLLLFLLLLRPSYFLLTCSYLKGLALYLALLLTVVRSVHFLEEEWRFRSKVRRYLLVEPRHHPSSPSETRPVLVDNGVLSTTKG